MRLDRFVPFLEPLGFLSGPLVRLAGAAAASGVGDSEGATGPCRCWFTGPSLVIWTGVGCTTAQQNCQHIMHAQPAVGAERTADTAERTADTVAGDEA